MRSTEIPQVSSLADVRTLVAPLVEGPATLHTLRSRAGLKPRAAGYRMNAARTFGWVVPHQDALVLTPLGHALMRTSIGSEDERAAFIEAFRESRALRRLDEDLRGPTPPSEARLSERIVALTDLSKATADRRAQDLLRLHDEAFRSRSLPLFVADPGRGGAGSARPGQAPSTGLVLARVEIENFGPIRAAQVDLGVFVVIIGRNATGKSTFLDTVSFVADCLESSIEAAIRARAAQFEDLLWSRQGDSFRIALEFDVRAERRVNQAHTRARYELEIGEVPGSGIALRHEQLWLKPDDPAKAILNEKPPRGWMRVLSSKATGQAFFKAETGAWKSTFNIGNRKLALSQLPEDRFRFPVTVRLQAMLTRRVQKLALRAEAMTQACSPLAHPEFHVSGSNLPLVVRNLKQADDERFAEWLSHVQEALGDITDIRVVEREEDRHLYLKVKYKGGLELPAWRLSDGTLRVLALTLIPFCFREDAIFLIEEPENGIHPQAIEAVHEVLSDPTGIQVLVATHSPVFVGIARPDQLLCFSRKQGQTHIIAGSEHPMLREWRDDLDLGTLFAADLFR